MDLLAKREEEIDSLSADTEDLKSDLGYTKVTLMKAKEEVEENFKRDAKLLNSRLASTRSLFESRLSQTESMTTNLNRIRKSLDVTVTLETIERKRSQYKNILTKYHETFKVPVKYKSSNVEETEEEVTLLKGTKESKIEGNILRGGSRIPHRTLHGAPSYDCAIFSQKLHEIEKILGRRGCAPGVSLDPPLIFKPLIKI